MHVEPLTTYTGANTAQLKYSNCLRQQEDYLNSKDGVRLLSKRDVRAWGGFKEKDFEVRDIR